MQLAENHKSRLETFICSESQNAFLLAWLFAAVAVGGVALVLFWFGAPVMNGDAWDSAVVLDGAWRILHGQVPHRDFYNFLGDLVFYLTALGMKLRGPCVSAIDYGSAVLMIILSILSMVLLRRRTSALFAFLFTVFLALLVATPRPMGATYDFTDHAMLYNRYGEAFILLFGLILFLPPRAQFGQNRDSWWEAVIAGLLWAGMLGSKMNYAGMGVVFFVVACALGRIRPGWALVFLASAASFVGAASALSGIPLAGLVGDYRILDACQATAGGFTPL
jgi:hypothetical protein